MVPLMSAEMFIYNLLIAMGMAREGTVSWVTMIIGYLSCRWRLWLLMSVGLLTASTMSLIYQSPSGMVMLVVITVLGMVIRESSRIKEKIMSSDGKTVLIIGCERGFGYQLACHLDVLGVQVFAGCLSERSPEARRLKDRCSQRLHIVKLDVTNEEQIHNARSYVENHLSKFGLWAVVNCTEMYINGDLEVCTMDQFQKVVDVNMFGLVRVTKTFIPLIKHTQGRIVNVCHAREVCSKPFSAAFTITKHAARAFWEILHEEMKTWGVKVITIETGHLTKNTLTTEPDHLVKTTHILEMSTIPAGPWDNVKEGMRSAYAQEYIDSNTRRQQAASAHLELLTTATTEAVLAFSPKTEYTVGCSNWHKWFALGEPYLPIRRINYLANCRTSGIPSQIITILTAIKSWTRTYY